MCVLRPSASTTARGRSQRQRQRRLGRCFRGSQQAFGTTSARAGQGEELTSVTPPPQLHWRQRPLPSTRARKVRPARSLQLRPALRARRVRSQPRPDRRPFRRKRARARLRKRAARAPSQVRSVFLLVLHWTLDDKLTRNLDQAPRSMWSRPCPSSPTPTASCQRRLGPRPRRRPRASPTRAPRARARRGGSSVESLACVSSNSGPLSHCLTGPRTHNRVLSCCLASCSSSTG